MEHSQLLRERMRTPPRVRRTVGDEDVLVPGRLTNDIWLTELSALPTVVECEYPQERVEIVLTLAHHEAYSAECESRNPEDALIHARLYAIAVRATFEQVLIDIANYDGI